MVKRLLISFEGGEGGGKSTQILRLQAHLIQQGFKVVVLREPGGTPISEQIRSVVLSAKNLGIAYTTEVLLFQAARAQLYEEVVIPSLAAGKVVLMDRTRDSSVVYQGVVRGFGEKLIEQLNNISTHETYPYLTLLLDVDVQIGLERQMAAGGGNRFEMENTQFHDQVRQAYLNLAKVNDHGRWVVVDAGQSLAQVEQAIWTTVTNKIQLAV